MSIKTEEELKKLKVIGRIVRRSLDQMSAAVQSGITTLELDRIGHRMLEEHGAEAAPKKVYGFPGAVCISVNDEAVHGVPGGRVLRDGDLPVGSLRTHNRHHGMRAPAPYGLMLT